MDALAAITATPLDLESPTPLYQQLKQRILQVIAAGMVDAREPIPTETALCEQLHLSRATVRRCFKDLVDDGFVTRRRGHGTFVTSRADTEGVDSLYTTLNFSTEAKRAGKVAHSKVIRLRIIPANATIARRLGIETSTPVWEVARVRYADDSPTTLEVAYLERDLCPRLAETDLTTHSLYERINEEAGILPARAVETMEAVTLDAHEARLLGVRKGTAAFRVINVSYDARNQPFETSVGFKLGDRFHFEATYDSTGASIRKVLC